MTCEDRDALKARVAELEATALDDAAMYESSRKTMWAQTKADTARIAALEAELASDVHWAAKHQELKTCMEALTTQLEMAECCWHCHAELVPMARPRCTLCPDECDVEGCGEPGCDGAKP